MNPRPNSSTTSFMLIATDSVTSWAEATPAVISTIIRAATIDIDPLPGRWLRDGSYLRERPRSRGRLAWSRPRRVYPSRREEYHRMAEVGILTCNDRVELI